jgi:hypothetical protein
MEFSAIFRVLPPSAIFLTLLKFFGPDLLTPERVGGGIMTPAELAAHDILGPCWNAIIDGPASFSEARAFFFFMSSYLDREAMYQIKSRYEGLDGTCTGRTCMECYALVFWDRELADPRGVAGNDASHYHPGNGLCLRCHLNHLHELLERYNAQFAAYLATNAGATWSDDESETLDAPARRPESVVPVTVREVSTDGPEPPEEPDDDALAAYAARA